MNEDDIAAETVARDSRVIANRFIQLAKEAGNSLSITQLVKLTYLAHGWHWGIFGEPLSAHSVEAWRYGPVIPEVYYAFSDQRSDVLEECSLPDVKEAKFSEKQEWLLRSVYKAYGNYSPFGLSALTHQKGSPWEQTYIPGVVHLIIPDRIIRDHYVELKDRNSNG